MAASQSGIVQKFAAITSVIALTAIVTVFQIRTDQPRPFAIVDAPNAQPAAALTDRRPAERSQVRSSAVEAADNEEGPPRHRHLIYQSENHRRDPQFWEKHWFLDRHDSAQ